MKTISGLLLAATWMSLVFASGVSGAASVEARFSIDESAIIRDFYSRNEDSRKPGKKKGIRSLPPGIAKNLARGKPLPPGIAKQVLPADLVTRLPPVRPGFERVIAGGKVLLIETATQVIHDILVDVILH